MSAVPDPAALREFAQGLRAARTRAVDEREMIGRARGLAVALASRKHEWLTEAMCRPDAEQGFGMHVLTEEADHSLAAFVVSWVPGGSTVPHDHGTWAVIVGLDGCESNRMWRRVDDRSRNGYAELVPTSSRAIGPDDVVAMPSGAIHSVTNDGAAVSVSLHVYGMHINHTGRSQFDPQARTEKPYEVHVTA
jgi:predicted metal-dependent enzyme (double-stranded beta helix superfamily)